MSKLTPAKLIDTLAKQLDASNRQGGIYVEVPVETTNPETQERSVIRWLVPLDANNVTISPTGEWVIGANPNGRRLPEQLGFTQDAPNTVQPQLLTPPPT
jgi:hypothetical protein